MDAPKLALPAEICAQVVQYARFGDLPAIGRTSKAFQILAETRLYNHIILKDMETLNRVGNSLFTPARGLARAPYVRRLWVYRDPRTAEGPWRDPHWRVIVILLPMLINLDSLIIWDDTSVHTWCLDAPTIRFQVREANFVFNWDDSLASFLEGQHELRSLIIQAPDEDENTRRILAPGSLQKLESFDGPLFVAIDLMTSPLKRLCIRVDEENAPLFSSYITELSRINKTLSSLNVLHIPEYLVADSLRVLALSPLSSSLRYLGIVNLPLGDRNDIYPSLLKLEHLEVLHIDLSYWTPLPMPCHFPMLATELRTYCATLRCVVIWVHTQQWFGRHEPEQEHWVFQHLPGQRFSARDVQWRDY